MQPNALKTSLRDRVVRMFSRVVEPWCLGVSGHGFVQHIADLLMLLLKRHFPPLRHRRMWAGVGDIRIEVEPEWRPPSGRKSDAPCRQAIMLPLS